MSRFAAGQTALVVVVPSAEPVVARLRALAGCPPFAARVDRLHLITFDGAR